MEGYLATAGFSTSAIVITGLVYKGAKSIIGRRLISDCCGKNYEVGLDIRDMPHSPKRKGTTHPTAELEPSSENQHESPSKEPEHREALETEQSARKHPHPKVEAEETAPESVDSASSESKESESETSQQSIVKSFWPLSWIMSASPA